jgi:hypothetical protein
VSAVANVTNGQACDEVNVGALITFVSCEFAFAGCSIASSA